MNILKRYAQLISVLILIGSVYIGFSSIRFSAQTDENNSLTEFSLGNALKHLKEISKEPHFTGSEGHENVRKYIVSELEKMGLEVEIQEQMAMDPKYRSTAKTKNILAKISGSEKGKSLLLMTHYDSEPHVSLGASDAGSGVATILEGVRAFLSTNKQVRNDIVICISDAEEIELLGAVAFVKHHRWAKNVGLALNFEARGSGGPSYMLIETNGGNKKLIDAFSQADPPYPLASSLLYSIYKLLPNDTDLTILREDGDINGFNFAFIGDHFDYHTAQDTFERMDKNSLQHHASYLMPALHYFSNSNLDQLNDPDDVVYFNFPLIGLIYYPFSWVVPLFYVSCLLFCGILILGFFKKRLSTRGILRGFIPCILSFLVTALVTIYGWKLALKIYPQYADILQGFTYNGYYYIIAFVSIAIACCFWIYQKFFQKIPSQDLLIAPLLIWILINGGFSFYLKGAGFFILPVLLLLLMLAFLVYSKFSQKHLLFFTLLSAPILIIFAPLIKMFPVGLGLRMLVASAVLIVLLFGFLIPLLQHYRRYKIASTIFLFIGIVGLVSAASMSGYNEERKQPNSILYLVDVDKNKAYWGSFNSSTDAFTEQFLGENPVAGSFDSNIMSSKYNLGIQMYKETSVRDFQKPLIRVISDTIIENLRTLKLTIKSERKAHKFELVTEFPMRFTSFRINGEEAKAKNTSDYVFSLQSGSVTSYFLTEENEIIDITMVVEKGQKIELVLYESKYDLLSNDQFQIKPRKSHMMPMPFVMNDATIIKTNLKF